MRFSLLPLFILLIEYLFMFRKPRDEKATIRIPSNPREEMKKYGKIISQKKSKEMIQQELISHLQNFQETFNEVELNIWRSRHDELIYQLTSV